MARGWLNTVASRVQRGCEREATGHDWWHIYRVRAVARSLARAYPKANLALVELASLVHDVGDDKLRDPRFRSAGENIRHVLRGVPVPEELLAAAIYIAEHLSFGKNLRQRHALSLEGRLVQDADRLEAIGAIGVARAFTYGGARGRQLHDPSEKPRRLSSNAQYRGAGGTTINHFYEKLLKVRDTMNTAAGRRLAAARHRFLEKFLKEFFAEWQGKA